jgi:hypothetical protein
MPFIYISQEKPKTKNQGGKQNIPSKILKLSSTERQS